MDRLDVQTILQVLEAGPVLVHQRDVEGLVGEVFGEGAAGLTGTEDEDLHDSIRVGRAQSNSRRGGIAHNPYCTSK